MKNLGTLTIAGIVSLGGFVGTTEGQRLVAGFVDSVNKGELPDVDAMERLAYALLPIVYDGEQDTQTVMAQVAERLELKRKQGKATSTKKGWRKQAEPVADYLQRIETLVEGGTSEKEATKKARSELCEAEHIGDRAARNRIDKHEERARMLLDFRRMTTAIWQTHRREHKQDNN